MPPDPIYLRGTFDGKALGTGRCKHLPYRSKHSTAKMLQERLESVHEIHHHQAQNLNKTKVGLLSLEPEHRCTKHILSESYHSLQSPATVVTYLLEGPGDSRPA